MGAPKISVEVTDEGDAVFAEHFREPSFPVEKRKRDPTETELKEKLSWQELGPDGKIKKYKIKSLPKTPKDKKEQLSFDPSSVFPSINHEEPTSGDNSTDEKRYIFTPDTRWRVWNTAVFPHSVVGLLRYTIGGGVGKACTATLISPNHVLTAGHCVNAGAGGGWYSDFKFYPGQNSAPLLTTPYFVGTYLYTTVGWASDGDFDYDFAVVLLGTTNTGKGWMSFGWTSSLSSGWIMNDNGYPGDKDWGTQWHTDSAISEVETNSFSDSSLDLFKGNSGSGTYAYWSSTGARIIYGVFSAESWEQYWDWGCFCIKTRYYNHHVRLTDTRFNLICNWINNPSIC